MAHLYAVLNDQPNTLRYLKHAYVEGNPWLLNVQVDPAMDSLRSSPDFLSAYRTHAGDKLWIITESDRSVTTLLLPEEY